jgi:hypothetical protein
MTQKIDNNKFYAITSIFFYKVYLILEKILENKPRNLSASHDDNKSESYLGDERIQPLANTLPINFNSEKR